MQATFKVGAAVLAWACLAAACAPMRVSSHVDRARDFTQYRTFDWGAPDALPASDPRLERNAFFQDHIQGAIERNLAARGLRRADASAVPDVRVHFHAVIARRLDVDQLDGQRGYCDESGCRAGVSDYERGTLVIDMIDVRTNRLVWAGGHKTVSKACSTTRIGCRGRSKTRSVK